MANMKIIGNTAVVYGPKLEDLKIVQKSAPKALELYEEVEGKKEITFQVAVGEGPGTLTRYGAEFSNTTLDPAGRAVINIEIKGEGLTADSIKETIADLFGEGLLKLAKVEAQIPAALEKAEAERAAALELIEIG